MFIKCISFFRKAGDPSNNINANVFVTNIKAKSRKQSCKDAEEAMAGGPNKANIFMSF